MIEAITLGSTYQESYAGLKALFQEHGLEYFSSISYDDTNFAINCYITIAADDPETPAESVCMLRIVTKQSPLSITVNTKYGFTRTFTVATRYFQGAYVVRGGITLRADNNLIPAFTICKDKKGNTTLIYTETLSVAAVGLTSNIFTVNINTTTPQLQNAYQTITTPGRGDFIKTVIAPVLVNGNDGDYVDDVQFIVTAQFTMTGNYARTWVIDGKDYFSNGLWVVKDQ